MAAPPLRTAFIQQQFAGICYMKASTTTSTKLLCVPAIRSNVCCSYRTSSKHFCKITIIRAGGDPSGAMLEDKIA